MLRIVLPIIVALVMVLAAFLVVFSPPSAQTPVVSAPASGAATGVAANDPAAPGAAAPPALAPEALAAPANPVTTRSANTLLANPFPNDASLAPTLISLDLQRADLAEALSAFSNATQLPVTLPTAAAMTRLGSHTVDMRLVNQPMLEGLLEIEAQGGATGTISTTPRLALQYATPPKIPGAWCVAGPFALVANTITHTYTPGRGRAGTVVVGVEPGGYSLNETLMMQLAALVEPKLRVLQYPGTLELAEVTDEKGHSLIPANAGTVSGRGPNLQRGGRPMLSAAPTFTLPLTYPQADAGRLIKILKGTGQFVVQIDAPTPVVFDDPVQNETTDKKVNGVSLSAGKLAWNQKDQSFEWTLTVRRDGMDPAQWDLMPRVLAANRPVLDIDPSFLTLPAGSTNSSANDQLVIRYTFRITVKNAAAPTPQAQAPPVARITLDLAAPRLVTVPFEFHDLPLP